MTDSEKVEFKKYGCLSKAIIKACDSDISIEDFCAKYHSLFYPQFYGMPRFEERPNIIKDFGYLIVSDEWDFEVVLKEFSDGHPIITMSHVMLREGDDSELNHSTVLHSISDNDFQIWTAYQNGFDDLMPLFPRRWWVEKKFHGLILTPRDALQNTNFD